MKIQPHRSDEINMKEDEGGIAIPGVIPKEIQTAVSPIGSRNANRFTRILRFQRCRTRELIVERGIQRNNILWL